MFSKFSGFIKNKRTKLILAIAIAAVIVGSGTIFALAKTGVIHLKIFASPTSINFYVEPKDSQGGADLSPGITVSAAIPGQSGIGTTTQQHTGIDGNGNTITKNVAILSLNTDTIYNISVSCPSGSTGGIAQVNSNSYYGSTFFSPLIVNPTCGGGTTTTLVQGQITKAGNNLTIPGASVTFSGNSSASATSDGSGTYSIPGIAPGTYGVTVSASGYDTLNQSVTLNAGANQKNFSLVPTGTQTPHNLSLYIDVKTSCADTTCTNQDAQGKVGGIPVSFGGFSGVTTNSIRDLQGNPAGYNLQFPNVPTGDYTFNINSSTATGYNPAYESQTVTQTVYNPTSTSLVIFNLGKKTVLPQTSTFDFIGSVKDNKGTLLSPAYVNVGTPVGCKDSPTFSCPWNLQTTSGTLPAGTDTHGITTPLNFSKTGLYNIAQAGAQFSSYTGTIGKDGYQVLNFTISVTDIKVDSKGKSYFSKDFTMIGQKPDAPKIGTATAGNASAKVTFTPPTTSGYSAITSYTVTSTPGGKTASGAASPVTVPSLTNETSYTFTVHATNATGSSPESTKSNAVTPTATTRPAAPTSVTATAGVASNMATVSWTAPSNGGSPITSYTITPRINGAEQVPMTIDGNPLETTANIAGLNNGQSYTFTVYATNSVGDSLKSAASNAITPTARAVIEFQVTELITELKGTTSINVNGASITIVDVGCGLSAVTGATDSNGYLLFSGPNISKYLLSSSCVFRPQATISKTGYRTIVANFSANYENFVTLPLMVGSSNVRVHVSDDAGKIVDSASVSETLVNNPAILDTKTTDTNGDAFFTISNTNKYIFNASKANFTQLTDSTLQTQIDKSKNYSIELTIRHPADTSSQLLDVTVLQFDTLDPITGVSVTCTDLSVNPHSVSTVMPTDANGQTQCKFKFGHNYDVKAGIKDSNNNWIEDDLNPVSIPPSFMSPNPDANTFQLNHLILHLKTSPSTVSSVNINVISNTTNQRVPGATIIYNTASTYDCDYKTKTTGDSFNLLADFAKYIDPNVNPKFPKSSTIDNCLPTTGTVKFADGESLTLDVTAPGYQEQVFHQTINETITLHAVNITLALDPITSGQIIVDADGLNLSMSDPANFILEKSDGNGHWVKLPQKPVNIIRNGPVATQFVFVSSISGVYRAEFMGVSGTTPNNQFTNQGVFDGKSTTTLNLFYSADLSVACNATPDQIVAYVKDGITLVFADPKVYIDNKEYWNQAVKDLTSYRSKMKTIPALPLVILVRPIGDDNSYSMGSHRLNCGRNPFSNQYYITIGEELVKKYLAYDSPYVITLTMLHEYTHTMYGYMREEDVSGKMLHPQYKGFLDAWLAAWNGIKALPTSTGNNQQYDVWNLIDDAIVDHDPSGDGGHPWDSDNEMLASLCQSLYGMHDSLISSLNNQASAQARNIVSYLVQIVSETMVPVSNTDLTLFKPVGGSIGNSKYTFDQIKSGLWKQSNYNTASLLTKSQIQYSRIIEPVFGQAITTIKNAVLSLNNLVNSLIANLSQTGSIRITVIDKANHPITNNVITIGPKSGVTDSSGQVIISSIPPGINQSISDKTSSGQNYAIIKPLSAKINISVGTNPGLTIQLNK